MLEAPHNDKCTYYSDITLSYNERNTVYNGKCTRYDVKRTLYKKIYYQIF